MPIKPIAKETEALLDSLADTATSMDDAYAAVLPLHDLLEGIRSRAGALELLRRQADAAEESPEVFNLFERVKQKNRAALRLCDEAMAAFDALTDTMYQLHQYGQEMRTSIDTREQRLARGGRPVVVPPDPGR